MSDQRLRELERRWKETGSPDDEAAYLLERVRVGDLTRERLELAAYCGHEGAIRSLGQGLGVDDSDIVHWTTKLSSRWSQEVCVRAAVAASSAAPAALRDTTAVGSAVTEAKSWLASCDTPATTHGPVLESAPPEAEKLALLVAGGIRGTLTQSMGWGVPAASVARALMVAGVSEAAISSTIRSVLIAWALSQDRREGVPGPNRHPTQ